MFRLLIDTCVWLDLAKDPKQHPVLGVVEHMQREKLIALIVPELLLDELKRNRARIEKDSVRSLGTHFKLVKDAVEKSGGNKRTVKTVLAHLDDVDHKIPLVGGAATQALDRIDKLLTGEPATALSEGVQLRAAQRALHHRAPFHRDRNSMADALLIETYAECLNAPDSKGIRFAFVTHNKNDFSVPSGNHKLPHPDIANLFSKVRSLYFVNFVEALRRVDPSKVSELMLEYSFDQEPRSLREILQAEELLYHQVWHNRHMNLRWRIERGKVKVVDRETWEGKGSRNDKYIIDSVWEGALRAAAATRKTYGRDKFGPYSDFEWGMINGKLSALRWALGDDWDMLDT
jgi:PIN domain